MKKDSQLIWDGDRDGHGDAYNDNDSYKYKYKVKDKYKDTFVQVVGRPNLGERSRVNRLGRSDTASLLQKARQSHRWNHRQCHRHDQCHRHIIVL